jgi:outer membrane protein assembly factor BamB
VRFPARPNCGNVSPRISSLLARPEPTDPTAYFDHPHPACKNVPGGISSRQDRLPAPSGRKGTHINVRCRTISLASVAFVTFAGILIPTNFVVARAAPIRMVAPLARPSSATSSDVVGGVLYAVAPSPSDVGFILGATVYALNVSTGVKLWTRFILGGQGGLAVSDGTVYLSWQLPSAASGGLYALRATNGGIVWKTTFTDVSNPSAPVAGTNLLYAAFYQSPTKNHLPGVCAFHPSGGSLAWCQKLAGGGVNFLPVVQGSGLYVSERDRIEAFDATTGHHLWSDSVSTTSAPAVDPGTAVIVAGTYNHASQVVGLNPATGAVLWSQPVSNLYQTPILVSNGTAYLAGFDSTVYALDAASGAKTWSVNTHDTFVPTLFVASGVLYAGGPTTAPHGSVNAINALNAATGQQLWQWSAPGMDGAEVLGVSNDTVAAIETNPNELFGLSSSQGTVRWTYPTDRGVDGAPLVSGSTIFAGSADTCVYALHGAGGGAAWSTALGGPVSYPPVLFDHNILAVTGYPDDSLHALNASTGKPLWFHAFQSDPITAPPITTGNAVVVATGDHVYAFNPDTGALRWTHKNSRTSELYDRLATSGGTVFVVSTADAHAHVTALNASTGHGIWSFDTGGGEGPMAIATGVLYISGRSRIVALHASSGKLIWQHVTKDPAFSSVAVAGHTVYAGAENPGNVSALSTGTGKQLWVHTLEGRVGTLVVSGTTIFAGADRVSALKAATGHVLWTSVVSDGAAVTASAGSVYVGAAGPRYGGVYKLDAETGHPIWTFLTARSPT